MRLGLAVQPQSSEPLKIAAAENEVRDAIASWRNVWFPGTGFVDTPIYDRAKLGAGHSFDGPAIVEQTDSTTVVPPDAAVEVDALGNILIRLGTLA